MHWIVGGRPRTVARRSARGGIEPEWRFLGRADSVILDAAMTIGPCESPFVQQELGVANQISLMLDDPGGSDTGADLFI